MTSSIKENIVIVHISSIVLNSANRFQTAWRNESLPPYLLYS
jgi:type IV secretory pathway TrbF-like protein